MTSAERLEWLKTRQTGIGGSDVAAILGISKWTTPLDVYNEKVADTPTEKDSDSMEWGRRLEPVIRQAYADKTGRVVAVPEKQFRSDAHPFMIANVDGVCEDRLLEIKTARSGADWAYHNSNFRYSQIISLSLHCSPNTMNLNGNTAYRQSLLFSVVLYQTPSSSRMISPNYAPNGYDFFGIFHFFFGTFGSIASNPAGERHESS